MQANASAILVADDDQLVRDVICNVLSESGHQILLSSTAAETWKIAEERKPDLVLLDLKFPDGHGLDLLKRIKRDLPDTEVVIISSQVGDAAQIVEAIKLGAYDYVPKPFEPGELQNRVEKALAFASRGRSETLLLNEIRRQSGFDALVGETIAMCRVRETLQRIASVDSCVLITGESGTGKELAARALHYLGPRKSQPFVKVNCAAIPESLVESVLFGHRKGAFTGAHESIKGRFEAAGEGTLFLDEIGDMPMPQQASLLEVLEYRTFIPVGETKERRCRARFVLATNRDLREAVKAGTFREDLFYRINVGNIVMPPLRTRIEDIASTAAYYCERFCADMGRRRMAIEPEAVELMCKYDWRGNVRELKNTIESVIMNSDLTSTSIAALDLPADLVALQPEKQGQETLSAEDVRHKRDLLQALQQTSGNQREAARILGWHRNTVQNRIRRFGIKQVWH